MCKFVLASVVVAGIALSALPQQVHASVKTGEAAPDFTLTDVNGNAHTLSSHKGKIVVLEWTNYDCPFVRKFYNPGAMQALQAEVAEKGVVWLTINSSAPGKQGNFSKEVWLQRMAAHNAVAPVLLDEDGTVGRAYGARTTPHMFVIHADGTIVYQGAIDSIRSTNAADIEKADNYVRAAVVALLAGEPVETTDTRPYGCSIKY
jgi:peroxiredoxin